jgi:sirohydrochlorin ferrochelatase
MIMGRTRSCFTGKSAALLGLVLLQVHLSFGYTVTLSREHTTMMRRSPRLLLALAASSSNNNNAADDDDLLFDPLLSPHAYPDGTDAGPKKVTPNQNSVSRPRKSFGIALPTDETEIMMPTTTTKPPSRAVVESPFLSAAVPDVFDPTLSPHMYSNGTPNVVIGEEKTTDDDSSSTPPKVVLVGILLMDHGSKSAVANERLVTLANLYQQQQRPSTASSSSSSTRRIVRAAHMELASPSIRDGIESLINEGVDEIICHPYFLSPGRHVREDIPNLVNEAIASLNVKIPVVITEPVGSNTDMMIQAIDVMVAAAAAQQQQRVGK